MPVTALNHLRQDIGRAKAIVDHADALPTSTAAQQLLRSDLLRIGWMFAVGALDAYFCDAYTDVVAATIISKSRQPSMALPDFFYEVKFPVRAILEPYTHNENWRWRMAARKMMVDSTAGSWDENDPAAADATSASLRDGEMQSVIYTSFTPPHQNWESRFAWRRWHFVSPQAKIWASGELVARHSLSWESTTW